MSIFTKVKGLRPKKNAFNLTHQIAQTQDIGQIMPCYLHDGILPNSRETMAATSIVQFQALLAPLKHKVDLYAHFWYVPYRIIDKDFPKFISGQMERSGQTYNCPVIRYDNVAIAMHAIMFNLAVLRESANDNYNVNYWLELLFRPSGLLCYLNYPSINDDIESHINDWNYDTEEGAYPAMAGHLQEFNVKRLQAYFFVIAQNYLNENFTHLFRPGLESSTYTVDLVQELFNFALGDFKLLDSSDISVFESLSGLQVTKVEWCLAKILLSLFFRKGSCTMYRGYFDDTTLNPNFAFSHAWKKDYFTSALPFVQLGEEVTIPISSGSANISSMSLQASATLADGELNVEDGDGTANIDLDTGISINELRAANALQRLKEAYARFGTRFQEWLKGFWNQNSSDRSQQLPEWLGGYKVPVQISEIEQTSPTDSSELVENGSPLGTLAGKGQGIGGRKVYSRHFEEPGVVIGLCFLQPKAVYPTTGIDRFLLKTNNIYDYFTPQMEHLGEQEVRLGELYYEPGYENVLFGYQSRYAEYKQLQSKYRGQFATYLNFWHLGRSFGSSPLLNRNFIYVDPETMKRPFAVQTVEVPVGPGESESVDISSCMLWFNFDVKYIAPMSRFGTPALLN